MWTVKCLCNVLDWENDFGHCKQLNGFSPVWTLVWSFRWWGCEKDFVQRVQLNGFSPVWTLAWILSPDESLKDLSHTEHLKRLSEWTLKWILRMSDVGKDFVQWVQKWRFSVAAITSSLKIILR